MKNLENRAIDHTLSALEQAIENRKIQIQNARAQAGPSLLISHLYSEILDRAGGYSVQMTNALGQGRELVQGLMDKIVRNIREEPWDFVRKVAVYSFATGLFLSLRNRKSPTGEKE